MSEHPAGAWADEDGLRWYGYNGKDYLSVTSQRKVLGMSYRLHAWILKQLVEGIYDDLLGNRWVGPFLDEATVKREMRQHATKERDRKAGIGTDVHELIAFDTRMADAPEEYRPYLEQYAMAARELGISPILRERQVFSDRYHYAGSLDLLAHLRKYDEYAVVDLKTGSGTYPEHALQLMSYKEADFVSKPHVEGMPDEVDEEATRALHLSKGVGILHIQPDSWAYHRIDITPGLVQAFKAQAVLAQFYARVKDISQLEVKG